jgi:hypothetical protein
MYEPTFVLQVSLKKLSRARKSAPCGVLDGGSNVDGSKSARN